MKLDVEEYKRSVGMRISDFLAGFIPAVVVALWLPSETPFILGVFLVFCVVLAMDDLHFRFVEKPVIRHWYEQKIANLQAQKGGKE